MFTSNVIQIGFNFFSVSSVWIIVPVERPVPVDNPVPVLKIVEQPVPVHVDHPGK